MLQNHPWEKVILIDDDPLFLTINKRIIQQLLPEIPVQSFQDSMQGLHFLLRNFPEKFHQKSRFLILLDLLMPKISGIKLIDTLYQYCEGFEQCYDIVVVSSSVQEIPLESLIIRGLIKNVAQKPLTLCFAKTVLEKI
ncbi:hypothetical protein A33Q_0901 [Indibacter alkaliphilus LW1]|uniref:Response regulatory domain-containing protein n=1 Tax=Indibacter alkaliphilus (strain CCUG 57479 / KCTC 22604 / LW1) TaxID=1189612 RepID=S2E9D6_INDAL|nr:response regulator [Indibacter alkaliphilus]EOZ98918.1 hypothetical protein A33Q_0901 [Indibacter alkaliphilus LW1]